MSLENPKIILPDDKRTVSKLRRKLTEYAQRLENTKKQIQTKNSNWHPEQIKLVYKQFSDYFKLTVLSELLLKKELDTYDFSRELFEEGILHNKTTVDNYNNACGVINDYCETGGKNCINGTGLK